MFYKTREKMLEFTIRHKDAIQFVIITIIRVIHQFINYDDNSCSRGHVLSWMIMRVI